MSVKITIMAEGPPGSGKSLLLEKFVRAILAIPDFEFIDTPMWVKESSTVEVLVFEAERGEGK